MFKNIIILSFMNLGGGRKLPYLQNEAQFQNPSLAGHQAGRQAVEEGARTGENGGICQFYK